MGCLHMIVGVAHCAHVSGKMSRQTEMKMVSETDLSAAAFTNILNRI